jgi:hypothetical protein
VNVFRLEREASGDYFLAHCASGRRVPVVSYCVEGGDVETARKLGSLDEIPIYRRAVFVVVEVAGEAPLEWDVERRGATSDDVRGLRSTIAIPREQLEYSQVGNMTRGPKT